jgi:hypothetical protein
MDTMLNYIRTQLGQIVIDTASVELELYWPARCHGRKIKYQIGI